MRAFPPSVGPGVVVVDPRVAVGAVDGRPAEEHAAGGGVEHVLVAEPAAGLDVRRPARTQTGRRQEPDRGGVVVVGPDRAAGLAGAGRGGGLGLASDVAGGEVARLGGTDAGAGSRLGECRQPGDRAALDRDHPTAAVDVDLQAVAEDRGAGDLLGPGEMVDADRVDVVTAQPEGGQVGLGEAEDAEVATHVAHRHGGRGTGRRGREVAVGAAERAHGAGERVEVGVRARTQVGEVAREPTRAASGRSLARRGARRGCRAPGRRGGQESGTWARPAAPGLRVARTPRTSSAGSAEPRPRRMRRGWPRRGEWTQVGPSDEEVRRI